ncbi:hypothetical protein LguiA_011605 [Lonicera macranthoides]
MNSWPVEEEEVTTLVILSLLHYLKLMLDAKLLSIQSSLETPTNNFKNLQLDLLNRDLKVQMFKPKALDHAVNIARLQESASFSISDEKKEQSGNEFGSTWIV